MTTDLFSVHDRIVVITGGLGQLGRQFTMALLERGARVFILDRVAEERPVPPGWETFCRDNRLGIRNADITRKGEIQSAIDSLISQWGIPQALINNAALDSPPNAPVEENGPFETYPETSWDDIMAVNVKGVFLCCQIIGGAMAAAGRGSIININSTYGMVSPDQRIYAYRGTQGASFYKPVSYAASKSAILNMTQYLATYWAGREVRVNTLTFGGVFNHQDDAFLEGYCKRVPLGRMAREDEYNGAVIFLISDASSYMTGSNLIIDGGWTAW